MDHHDTESSNNNNPCNLNSSIPLRSRISNLYEKEVENETLSLVSSSSPPSLSPLRGISENQNNIEYNLHNHTQNNTNNSSDRNNNNNNNHRDDGTIDDILYLTIDEAIDLIGYGKFQYGILVATGLAFMADAMELMLLSFLQVQVPFVHDTTTTGTKDNTSDKALFLTSIVFIGSFLGSSILSPASDYYGRRNIFLLSTIVLLGFFSIGTAFCTSYTTLILCRFLVGIGIGCVTIPNDIWIEFLPSKQRGTNMLWTGYFWTIGTIAVPAIAYVINIISSSSSNTTATAINNNQQHDNDWRYLVLICSLPCIVSGGVGYYYMPESPRWLLSEHYKKKNSIITNNDTNPNPTTTPRQRRHNNQPVLALTNNSSGTDIITTIIEDKSMYYHDEAVRILQEAVIRNNKRHDVDIIYYNDDHPLFHPNLQLVIIRNQHYSNNNHSTEDTSNEIIMSAVPSSCETNGNVGARCRNSSGGDKYHCLEQSNDDIMTANNNNNNVDDDDSSDNTIDEDNNRSSDNNDTWFRTFVQLFHKRNRRNMIFLATIWLLYPILYFGTILVTTTIIFVNNNNDDGNSSSTPRSFNYSGIFFSSFAEVIGLSILFYTIETVGRIQSQSISYLGGGIAMFLLCTINNNKNNNNNDTTTAGGIGSIGMAFIARMMYKIAVCTTWITTAEILPTSIRGTGHGFVNSIARLSAASSPYIMHGGISLPTIGWILLVISAIVSYLVHKIPETKGQQLQ